MAMQKLIGFDSLTELFSQGGIEVSGEQYKKLCRYAELLCEWNEKMNLTAITDPEGIALKHFFDSVYPFTLIEAEFKTLIDVGTGAGFPSAPLKIFRPETELTLLDSLNKRVNFLSTLSDELELGAKCIHGRAEQEARCIKGGNPMREAFDAATARAVANLRELCEYCMPFVKVGGVFIALKGKDGSQELIEAKTAVSRLGGELEDCREYSLPNGDERAVIVIRKLKPCEQKFPRNAGQIKKSPL